ncbi:MAG: glycosyltransferase involved in cell wall biosynthesis [Psychroserpens sp.]|jgi:glycosyltransferase involved in cell wall biosynthesis|uniref:glycosyltransferase n=1 Tax=Psychroserpens sp. TaxID=2020870 RepID=UPI0039E587A7
MSVKNSKIKILFILPSLKAGGAERVISFVSQNLDKAKFECVLVVIGHKESAVYNVDTIKVHFLNRPRLIKSIKPLFKIIAFEKPDIVVGSIAHVNRVLTLFRVYFRSILFVGREASLNGIISKFTNQKGFKYHKLYKNYHKNIDLIICQSHEMAQNVKKRFKIGEDKIAVINNPISSELPLRTLSVNSKPTRQLITIGRLSLEKGHKRIFEALSKLDIPFNYTIIGEGDQEDHLTQLAKELNILDKITYVKYTNDVAKYLSQSDLFLQGSFVEGFPNALLESCVIGTPVIAFNAPGGTREIVEHGVNGYLAEDNNEYLNYLQKALTQDWNPNTIKASVNKKFNKTIILESFEAAFENLMIKHNKN